MDGKRREEKAQDESKPKEKKAYGYEKSNQKWSYKDYVKFRDEAERKQKKKAESKAKDEKAKEKPRAQEQQPGQPEDLYAILDVEPSATQAELAKAARKKRIEMHPDKFSGRNLAPAEVDVIIEQSKTVGHAADILCDPVARLQYDEEVTAWKQQQKAAAVREDQLKYESTRFNAYAEARDAAAASQKKTETDQPKHQPAQFDPATDSRKASTHQKDASPKPRTYSSAYQQPIPHPPRSAARKSFGATDEPRFAHAAYSRPAGRFAGFPGPFNQSPSPPRQRRQEQTRYARSGDNWQHAKQARFGDYRDFLDDVVEDLNDIGLDFPMPARARFSEWRVFDRHESASLRDEREIREGYRADSRDQSPEKEVVEDADKNSTQFDLDV